MRSVYKVLSWLPLSLLYGVSTLAAALLYHVARYRRRTVADNLRLAFPALGAAKRRRIERAVYRHLCDVGVEIVAGARMTRAEFLQRLTVENPELLSPYKESKQPLLLLTCHQGNWEWLQPIISAELDCPIDAVYKPLHNRDFNDFVFAARSRSGTPIEFKDAGREILRRRREYRGFAMVADQSPFKRDKRYWRLFLGRPSSFYLGPQKIAEATQYPVVFVAMTKRRRGHYSIRYELLAEPPHAKGGFAILDRYIDAVERAVRAQPETWMWTNRKWKHRPPADWQQNPVT